MRKYPPATGTRRVNIKDYKVPNTNITLEKGKNIKQSKNYEFRFFNSLKILFYLGTNVMIPAFGIHFDPEIYPNPDKYDPDRFSPEEVEKRHHFTYLPFGKKFFEFFQGMGTLKI